MPMSQEKNPLSIAFFVSPHGFGHATRACAVMEALTAFFPSVEFDIFTLVPESLFRQSLTAPFRYHHVMTDVGLEQRTPLEEDIPATITRLEHFIPFNEATLNNVVDTLDDHECRVAVCDISPLGIEVARHAGIPSVLVENFTWDWIYEGYMDVDQRIGKFAKTMAHLFDGVDHHIATEPFHKIRPADLVTMPISREPRATREDMRRRLGIQQDDRMVLLTMGGVTTDYNFIHALESAEDIWFVIPGGSEHPRQEGNLILLPIFSELYHPDLVHAADTVVSKLGYSTLAEIYAAGIPFGYIPRKRFRESRVMAEFVDATMSGMEITHDEFYSCAWLERLDDLLSMPRTTTVDRSGATKTARFILDHV